MLETPVTPVGALFRHSVSEQELRTEQAQFNPGQDMDALHKGLSDHLGTQLSSQVWRVQKMASCKMVMLQRQVAVH